MVTLADPPLGNPDGYSAVRLYPRDGALAADGYGAQGLADYARQGLALVRRDFREGPHDELGLHPEVTCRSDAPIELMLDGERASGGREERFALVACDLRFLVSVDPAEAGAAQEE
jgi:hypothetical protein